MSMPGATTIAGVIDRLNDIIAESIAGNSRQGYFAALYKKVTVEISKKIHEGYFDDNERMERLDVIFANRYFEACDQYRLQQNCSASWKLSFDACNHWQPMLMHHLLTGMNAHIGLDLGIATATVAAGKDIAAVQHDFNKINIILCDMIAGIKATLYNMWPLSKLISQLHTDRLENDIAGFSMHIARDAAWQSALQVAACETDADRQRCIALRDQVVADFGNRLLHPGSFTQTVTAVFRLFEFGTVRSKIQRLDA